MDLSEFLGLLFIFLSSAISNAGGVGGGGLVIPILLLMMKFYTHEAIPISKLTIFTGALTSFLLGIGQKHPYRNSITIDYNIPYLIVPFLLLGTMVGISLNKVMPPWVILISLTLVLVINTYKTLSRARTLQKKETEEKGILKVDIIKNSIEIKNIGNYGKQIDDNESSSYNGTNINPNKASSEKHSRNNNASSASTNANNNNGPERFSMSSNNSDAYKYG